LNVFADAENLCKNMRVFLMAFEIYTELIYSPKGIEKGKKVQLHILKYNVCHYLNRSIQGLFYTSMRKFTNEKKRKFYSQSAT